MTTTVLVIGQMVGASVFPTLADKHGRLLIAYTTLMAVTVCFLLTAIVPWFAGFVVMRFLMGMLSQVCVEKYGDLVIVIVYIYDITSRKIIQMIILTMCVIKNCDYSWFFLFDDNINSTIEG